MIRTTAVLLALTAAAAAQRTIVVQGGGAALQQAVDAAGPGDLLDVHAATYSAVRVGKGITIACRVGVEVTGSTGYTLHVDSLPRGQTLIVAGGTYTGGGLLVGGPVGVTACEGTVVLEAVVPVVQGISRACILVDGNPGPVIGRHIDVGSEYFLPPLQVTNSAQVSFSHCANLPPVSASASRLSLSHCMVAARNASIGLQLASGDVTVTGGSLVGSYQFSAMTPQPGIRVQAGSLTLAGRTHVVGGRFNAVPAPAIQLWGGELRRAPTVLLVTDHPTPIEGPGRVVRGPVPSIAVDGTAPGGTLQVEVAGAPGSLTATFVDVPVPPLALPIGALWVRPDSPVLSVDFVPASGFVQLTGGVPTTMPAGLPLTFQPISLTAVGAVWIGAPSRTVLR